jgi:hypothetical protein
VVLGELVLGELVLGELVLGDVVLGAVVVGVLVLGVVVLLGWVVDDESLGVVVSVVAALATSAAPTAEPAAIPRPATTRSARRELAGFGGGGGAAAQGSPFISCPRTLFPAFLGGTLCPPRNVVPTATCQPHRMPHSSQRHHGTK